VKGLLQVVLVLKLLSKPMSLAQQPQQQQQQM
jgi:hypothetical protein